MCLDLWLKQCCKLGDDGPSTETSSTEMELCLIRSCFSFSGGPSTFSLPALGLCLSLFVVLQTLGISLSYHRHLTHRSFQCHKYFESLVCMAPVAPSKTMTPGFGTRLAVVGMHFSQVCHRNLFALLGSGEGMCLCSATLAQPQHNMNWIPLVLCKYVVQSTPSFLERITVIMPFPVHSMNL